jgi:hypothetical protein
MRLGLNKPVGPPSLPLLSPTLSPSRATATHSLAPTNGLAPSVSVPWALHVVAARWGPQVGHSRVVLPSPAKTSSLANLTAPFYGRSALLPLP